MDETDIRPTIMYLTGLRDDYEHDGRVITQILSHPNHALSAPGVTGLGSATSSSTPAWATSRLTRCRPTPARSKSSSPGDQVYLRTDQALRGLEVARDRLAGQIKGELRRPRSPGGRWPGWTARSLRPADHLGRARAGQRWLTSPTAESGDGVPAVRLDPVASLVNAAKWPSRERILAPAGASCGPVPRLGASLED